MSTLPAPLLNALQRIKPEVNIVDIEQVQQLIDDPTRRTLCDEVFFYNLKDKVELLANQKVEGDFVEAGVWRGGVAAFMKELLAYYNINSNVWLADIFDRQTPGNTYGKEKDRASLKLFANLKGNILPNQKEVASFLQQFGKKNTQTFFLEGSIFETLPTSAIEKISLLHIDVDFYEPTLFALETLYNKLVPGGYVIIDDYGAEIFNCREAVEDFRSKNNITAPMEKMGAYPVAWRK